VSALPGGLESGRTVRKRAAGLVELPLPLITPAEERQLLNFLQANRPRIELADILAGDLRHSEGRIDRPQIKDSKEPPKKVENLPPRLGSFPVVAYQKSKRLHWPSRDDNSNTQFGLLGLWAARRHGLPAELSLELAARRFRETQKGDGGWGYVLQAPTKNTMTCVGLLGLAMGHAAAEALGSGFKGKPPLPPRKDPFVHQALDGLGKYIHGDPSRKGLEARIDFYYLWTLERVGILYRQKTIGKKDWYRWGTRIIVKGQRPDGSWHDHYGLPADTSFALLFLNRSNLVGNLRATLPLYLAIPNQDPDLDRR
jgi:hypothetical protein